MTRRLMAFFGIAALSLLLVHTAAVGATPVARGPSTLHLPLILGHRPPQAPSIFGGEIVPALSPETVASLAGQAGVTLTRYARLSWAAVEPTPGARNWSALAGMERALAAHTGAGLNNLLIVGDAPTWARQDPTRACSPIKPQYLDEFAAFMAEATERFRRPPYLVNHFEIYNEPDVEPQAVTPTTPFGCWGNGSDPNYGGGYFSTMLSAIYAPMKAKNPLVEIVIGGLLLHCDYTYVYPNGADCKGSRFLRGILETGHGENFDAVAYHGYALQSTTRVDWDLAYYYWEHRGGVVLGKLDFIKHELAAASVEKPIYLTEAGLLCYEGSACDTDQTLLYQDQANYVVRTYSRGWAHGLKGVIWYTVNDPNWRRTGLLDRQSIPRPAYYAYRFMSSRLRNGTYIQQLSDGVNRLEGYRFRAGGSFYDIYWSNSIAAYPLAVPAGAAIFDKLGNSMAPPVTGVLLVGFEPVYVVTPVSGPEESP